MGWWVTTLNSDETRNCLRSHLFHKCLPSTSCTLLGRWRWTGSCIKPCSWEARAPPQEFAHEFFIHVGLLRSALTLLVSRKPTGVPQQGKSWKELSSKCLSQPYQGGSSAKSPSWTGNSLHLHSFPNRGHQWPDYNSTRQLDFNFIFPSTQGSYKKKQEGIAQWKNWIHTFFAAGLQPLY